MNRRDGKKIEEKRDFNNEPWSGGERPANSLMNFTQTGQRKKVGPGV